MIPIASSSWIDYFNGRLTRETDHLDALLGDDVAATGDLIVVEVLQGRLDDSDFASAKRTLPFRRGSPSRGNRSRHP